MIDLSARVLARIPERRTLVFMLDHIELFGKHPGMLSSAWPLDYRFATDFIAGRETKWLHRDQYFADDPLAGNPVSYAIALGDAFTAGDILAAIAERAGSQEAIWRDSEDYIEWRFGNLILGKIHADRMKAETARA